MVRIVRSVGVALALLVPAVASAEGTTSRPIADYVVVPPQETAPKAALTSEVIYLNKCAPPGCDLRPGSNNAAQMTSSLAPNPVHWDQFAWHPGEFEAVLKCVQEVYSPYNVTITDQRPTAGAYNMEILAGSPTDVGRSQDDGGVAPFASDCSLQSNSIAFAFTSAIDIFAQEDNNNRVWGMCWIAVQEIAHLYGIDHEYSWVDDNSSACNDPMTYRADCGGQKFFRNRIAKCGEFGPARPGCGPSNTCWPQQNSHVQMLGIFGPGHPITAPPVASITSPMGSTIQAGDTITVKASAQRGVALVELYINGHKWASAKGNAFDLAGQSNTTYTFPLSPNVPDGVMDIMVKAYDDIQVESDSPTVTVTKGAPCADASNCALAQKCDAGKCYWDPATGGKLGDKCTFAEYCETGMCEGTADLTVCTQGCVVGSTDACPMGFDCLQTTGNDGICFPQASGGGCCSIGSESHAPYAHGLLALGVLGFVARRRRRR